MFHADWCARNCSFQSKFWIETPLVEMLLQLNFQILQKWLLRRVFFSHFSQFCRLAQSPFCWISFLIQQLFTISATFLGIMPSSWLQSWHWCPWDVTATFVQVDDNWFPWNRNKFRLFFCSVLFSNFSFIVIFWCPPTPYLHCPNIFLFFSQPPSLALAAATLKSLHHNEL